MTPPTDTPSLPLFGPLARALRTGSTAVLLTLVLLLALVTLALAVKTWGLVALAMVALAAVPVCFLLLILISIGK